LAEPTHPPDALGDALPHVRPPKQNRSRQTLERIAEAALEIMAEVGPERATVAEIVKRAGASVGSFYARFAGKEELIRYLQDRVWGEAIERWDEAMAQEVWRELPLESVVGGVVGLLLRSFRADFQRRRVLGRGRLQDPEGARRVVEFHEHVLATVTPLLLARREVMTHPDPEAATRLGYRFAAGAIRELLETEGDTAALAPELARAWTAYLCFGAGGTEASPEGEVDFFDPWG